jgi:hypothetical protein
MPAYLFLWNPTKDVHSFRNFAQVLASAKAGEPYLTRWICPSRRPQPGDVAYLQRTGPKNNGLFARGVVKKEAYIGDDGTQVVDLRLDCFLPIGAQIPRAEIVARANHSGNWMPMASGNVIPDPIEAAIETLWPKSR